MNTQRPPRGVSASSTAAVAIPDATAAIMKAGDEKRDFVDSLSLTKALFRFAAVNRLRFVPRQSYGSDTMRALICPQGALLSSPHGTTIPCEARLTATIESVVLIKQDKGA